jgi:hypothetical protein
MKALRSSPVAFPRTPFLEPLNRQEEDGTHINLGRWRFLEVEGGLICPQDIDLVAMNSG